jgi:hypothetical protein
MTKKEMQSYLKRKDLVLENNTVRWEISTVGDIHGLYVGSFVFKCYLTPAEKLAAGRDYRELLGSNAVFALKHEDDLAFTLSQLKYRVISGPPFWSSALTGDGLAGGIADEKILSAIFEAATASEFKYIAMLQDKKEKALEKAKKVAEGIIKGKRKEEEELERQNQERDKEIEEENKTSGDIA